MRSAISVTDLAEILSMGRNTIYVMVRAGRIPSMRIGSTLRIDPAEVANWLEERTRAA
jgi:excisionase family DNA binding protein